MSKHEFGLVGEKLSHSYSKIIHAMLGDYNYGLLPMDEDEFDRFFCEKAFSGVNVTIPYKKKVIPYLDFISEQAKSIGSVNTVVCLDGKLYGYNTDYDGFLFMAERAGIDFMGKKVLVLGSGGASATVISAARDKGAREVVVVSRSGKVNYDNVYELNDADIIVNTTPVGMYPNNGDRVIDLSRFKKLSGVLDLIYNPIRTRLILDALSLGIPASGGLSMLVAQAVYANGHFFGKKLPCEKIEEVLCKIEKSVSNISLIGMPGCGKSTVGRFLADMLGMEFVDADDEITKSAGRTPAEIIKEDGEDAFRKIESEVVAEITRLGGRVISCGGGVVTREENYAHLKQNGDIYYIKRELSSLSREGRPLSANVEKLFSDRREKYERFADFEVENDADVPSLAEKIKKLFTKE